MIKNQGFSLIEMLVVMAVFSILGVLISQIIFLTIRSTNKNESSVKTRENINYAVAVMERNLRYAKSIITPVCDGTPVVNGVISYVDILTGAVGKFDCAGSSIASSSAVGGGAFGSAVALTNSDVAVSCTFSCISAVTNQPPNVDISIVGNTNKKNGVPLQGVESSAVTVQTKIYLRNN